MSDSIQPPPFGSEARDLVMDLRSNMIGLGPRGQAFQGEDIDRIIRRDALDAIERTWANPEAAAYLGALGNTREAMVRSVEVGDRAGALRRLPNLEPGQPAPDGLSPPEAREQARQVRSAIGDGTARDTPAAASYLGNLQRDAAPAGRTSQAQRDAARAASTAAPATAASRAGLRAQAVLRPSRATL